MNTKYFRAEIKKEIVFGEIAIDVYTTELRDGRFFRNAYLFSKNDDNAIRTDLKWNKVGEYYDSHPTLLFGTVSEAMKFIGKLRDKLISLDTAYEMMQKEIALMPE